MGLVIISAGFTAMIIERSFVNGRLSALPTYDDCGYLLDGINCLNVYESSGAEGLFRFLINEPPHSPYSSALSFLSFATLGRHDWSPYVSNGLIVFFALLYAIRLTRGVPRVGSWVGVGFMLVMPVLGWTVHEFRPDLVCGLFTAILICELIVTEPAHCTVGRSMLLGLILGISLWIKPTVFPMTGLLVGAAMGLLILRDIVSADRRKHLTSTLVFLFGVVSIGIGVFAPNLALTFNYLIEYIHSNIFGDRKQLWVMAGTWYEHFIYYMTGMGGQHSFGRLKWLLIPMLMVAIWSVAKGSHSYRRLTFVSLLATTAVAFLLPTLNPVKSFYFGAVFYYLTVFSLIVGFAWTLERFEGQWRGQFVTAAVALGMMVYGATGYQFPYIHLGVQQDASVVQNQVYEIIARHGRDNAKLAFTSTGLVNDTCMQYALLRDGYKGVEINKPWWSDNIAQYEQAMRWADIVVASEPGIDLVYQQFPCWNIQYETLELARSIPGLVHVGSVPTQSGPSFHVFARPLATVQQHPGIETRR